MGFAVLAMLIGLPLIEIAVFIAVGGQLGMWPTIGVAIFTAIAGTVLLRVQGFSALIGAQEAMRRGELPVTQMFEGLYLVIAGMFLLMPGFVTDALGLTLFLPVFRRWIGCRAVHAFYENSNISRGGLGTGGWAPPNDGPTIDGEYDEVPDVAVKPTQSGSQPPVVRSNDKC